jgi:succinyl-CoA synthetase alpha subunit
MHRLSTVKASTYQDSVRLMRLSQTVSDLPGVKQAFVALGTDANKRVLEEVGLLTDEVQKAGANDLFVVVEAETATAAQAAIAQADQLLLQNQPALAHGGAELARPKTQEQARRQLTDANLMLISVPGAYAALEAAKALQAGMHVFLFSDNVSVGDERALKELAVSKGLLMMGPGCGTAVINGVALAFANVLKRGPVGVVAASGTGLQELTTLIDRGGVGISQAIGVGGRDLSEAIGGRMMLQGISMLAADPQTQVIALISKPPHPSVTPRILAAARGAGKPVIVNFLGDPASGVKDGLNFTGTIEDTAEAVLRQVTGVAPGAFGLAAAELEPLVAAERGQLQPGQRYLRGLFSGGSLCDEAMNILQVQLGGIYSNIAVAPEWVLADARHSRGHCCVDLGEEEFTRGRPHPMIDLRLRQERLLKEADDPEVAVILMDIVLGYGSHSDPAGALQETIRQAKARAATAGRYLSVVTHVCGTAQDPQDLPAQERKLRQAGALVLPTNAGAARVAAAIAS